MKITNKFLNQVIKDMDEHEELGYEITKVFVCKALADMLLAEGYNFKVDRTEFKELDYDLPVIEVVVDDEMDYLYTFDVD